MQQKFKFTLHKRISFYTTIYGRFANLNNFE